MAEFKDDIRLLRIDYFRAIRCWRSNNLKSCLIICEDVSRRLNKLFAQDEYGQMPEVIQLKHLIWFLKIRYLADDYYVSESLLLNEDDIESEDQVRVFSSSKLSRANTTVRATSMNTGDGAGRKITTGNGKIETRPRTGIITGRMPIVSSRQSSRAATSYRPLTTSLTATQTAFSRSTRPLLKYSTCSLLSKLLFEYLYNAQAVTNKCPDYRQCLEYLNLVQNTLTKQRMLKKLQRKDNNQTIDIARNQLLLSTGGESDDDERKSLGIFWLVSFGTCYYNLHMNKQAEEYFLQAVAIDHKYLDSYAWLVKIYLRANQPTKVLKTCEDGLKHSKNAILYNWMARVQSLLSDLYAANANLKESLKYYPTNIEALANVGHFAFYGDKLEQSLKCFERIQQLSMNQSANLDMNGGSSASLLNNLALCNFYCGFYYKVLPLFLKAFLNSTSKEMTSNIWYNVSFIPMSFGFKDLAIACLKLALKNNSQNEEAINNLGVIKYGPLMHDDLHYENRLELWGNSQSQRRLNSGSEIELKNLDDQDCYQYLFDEAESYFVCSAPPSASAIKTILNSLDDDDLEARESFSQPEMLYNMAIIKEKRGQLLASVRYCNMYLEHDQNNYHIRSILKEIRQLVSHDS